MPFLQNVIPAEEGIQDYSHMLSYKSSHCGFSFLIIFNFQGLFHFVYYKGLKAKLFIFLDSCFRRNDKKEWK